MQNQLEALLGHFQGNAFPAMIADLGDRLRVSPESIRRVALGWAPFVPFKDKKTGEDRPNYQGWWAIPERDAKGRVSGLGLRSQDGAKLMYPGGHHGLIYEVNPDYVEQEAQDAAGGTGEGWEYPSPCPVCGNANETQWCAVADNGAVAWCHRKKEGAVRTRNDPDECYLHVLIPELYKGNQKPVSPLADNGGPVVVVEGMSDTTAAMDLGFNAVGKPSATAGIGELVKLLKGRSAIVMGENDRKEDGRWPGRDGAQKTATALAKAGIPVTLVFPPPEFDENGKPKKADLRSWYSGNTEVPRLTREQFDKYVSKEGVKVEAPAADPLVLVEGDEFFHDADGELYVRAKRLDGIFENLLLTGTDYENLISRRAFAAGEILKSQAKSDLLAMLSGRAAYEGPECPVHVRVGFEPDVIWLDLANESREVVRIAADGWAVLPDAECPLRFFRPAGTGKLPTPAEGGNLDALRPLLNVPDERAWVLAGAWLLSLFQSTGARPILHGHGTQGSAKSESCRKLRRLIDPHSVPDQNLPGSERDLVIAAKNRYVLAFDNLSELPHPFPDIFCRLSTGTGYSVRKHYTNAEETLIKVRRSIIVNSIPSDLLYREDVRDRALAVYFPRIEASARRSDGELETAFQSAWPVALGGLLNAVVEGLRRKDQKIDDELPRLADFYKWVRACEPAMPWRAGAFAEAFRSDREDAVASAIENSAVATVILRAIERAGKWEGLAGDLLAELHKPGNGAERWDVPKTAQGVGNAISRALPALANCGIIHSKTRTEDGSLHTFQRINPR